MLEKIKETLERQYQGGITTYILILFGMGFMLYLFGFKSFMDGYFANATVNGTTITSPNLMFTGNPIDALLATLSQNSVLAIGGGVLVSALAVIFARIAFGSGTASTIVSYIIPIGFLFVFMNLFVFPIATMQADLRSFDIAGMPASAGLFAFFNLFLILAIIDFVRGTTT